MNPTITKITANFLYALATLLLIVGFAFKLFHLSATDTGVEYIFLGLILGGLAKLYQLIKNKQAFKKRKYRFNKNNTPKNSPSQAVFSDLILLNN